MPHGRDDELPREAILTTLSELDKWRRRRQELKEELEKVDRQVSYYESLAREMKRDVKPPRVADMLKALFNF